MKDCAVMPYVVSLGRVPGGNVSDYPSHFSASRTELGLRYCDRLIRKIEDSDGLKTCIQESVDQSRCATADIIASNSRL